MTKKAKFILLGLVIILLLCFLIIYFYPVSEVSGIISDYTCFCYKIRSNGIVDYYVGYTYDILQKDPEEFDHEIQGKPYHEQKKLNFFQKIEVNNLVEKIKKNVEKSDSPEILYGTGGIVTTFNCVIDEYVYNSWIELDSVKSNRDLVELSFLMWVIKPEKCNEYWNFERSTFPGNVIINKSDYKDVLNTLIEDN